MDIFERMEQPTPKFFRLLRNIGLGMTAIGGAIVTAPVMLPTILVTFAGYIMVAGTVASVVSQTVINDRNEDDEDEDPPGTSGAIDILNRNPLLDPNG